MILKKFLEKDGLMNLDEDDVMMMLPPFFAPKDIPTNLVYDTVSFLFGYIRYFVLWYFGMPVSLIK